METSVSKRKRLSLAGLLAAVLILAACAAPTTAPGDTPAPIPPPATAPGDTPTPIPPLALAPSASAPAATPVTVPTQAPTAAGPTSRAPRNPSPELPAGEMVILPAARQAIDEARVKLAKRFGVPPDQVRLVSAEMVNWPDASLGCPEPGMMYAQVVTPGFKVVFEVNGQQVTFHGDLSGHIVECKDGVPVATRTAAQAAGVASTDAVAELASQQLAAQLGVSATEVQVVSVEPVEWRDSSLGCPEPGAFYLQVITPGYQVMLSFGGQQYEVHTDRGQRAIVCRSPA